MIRVDCMASVQRLKPWLDKPLGDPHAWALFSYRRCFALPVERRPAWIEHTRTFSSERITMTLRRHRRSWSWVVAVAFGSSASLLALPRSLHAEEDSATEVAAARALAVDGLKLAQAGKCDEAVPKLERSEKLHHSAIVLSRLGECNVSLGKLVEGTEELRKVLREPLPTTPSPALNKAYERAQSALDAAKPRIAALT